MDSMCSFLSLAVGDFGVADLRVYLLLFVDKINEVFFFSLF